MEPCQTPTRSELNVPMNKKTIVVILTIIASLNCIGAFYYFGAYYWYLNNPHRSEYTVGAKSASIIGVPLWVSVIFMHVLRHSEVSKISLFSVITVASIIIVSLATLLLLWTP